MVSFCIQLHKEAFLSFLNTGNINIFFKMKTKIFPIRFDRFIKPDWLQRDRSTSYLWSRSHRGPTQMARVGVLRIHSFQSQLFH